MRERIMNLLSLCMQAKERGQDCFFCYSPHVQVVAIDVHIPHWVPAQKDANGEFILGSDNNVWHIDFYVDDDTESEAKISVAETYLKGLIEA